MSDSPFVPGGSEPDSQPVLSREIATGRTLATTGVVTGYVQGLQQRIETASQGPPLTVFDFSVQDTREATARTSTVPVELRGRKFEGVLHEGDHVTVRGHLHKASHIFMASRVENLDTGATVTARRVSTAALVFAIAIFVLMGIFIAAILLSNHGSPAVPSGFPSDFPTFGAT